MEGQCPKFPKIEELHVGDVILIPPVEDLDPTYIDPPRSRSAPREDNEGVRDTAAGLAKSPPASATRESLPTARTTRASTLASPRDPAIRFSRADAVLDLPVGDTVTGRDRGSRRAGTYPADGRSRMTTSRRSA